METYDMDRGLGLAPRECLTETPDRCPGCKGPSHYEGNCARCQQREFDLHDVRPTADFNVYSMIDLFGMYDDPAIIYPRETRVTIVKPEDADFWIAVNGQAFGITMEPKGCGAQAQDFADGYAKGKHGEIYTTHKPQAGIKAWKAWEKKWSKRTA